MQIINKPIKQLIPYEKNPRRNDKSVEYHIYGIYNLVNGKSYIGQTRQGYRKRFIQHLCPKDGSPLLSKAVNKYGKSAFTCELLDIAYNQELANEKEKMWIKLLKTYEPEHGYNLSMGGVIGSFNKETLKKMSESHTGSKNHFFGKRHTAEVKEKMSICRKGKHKGEKHPQAKKIKCVETGIVYNCVVNAQKDTGVNSHHIGQVANGQYGRKTAGGYHWEWA